MINREDRIGTALSAFEDGVYSYEEVFNVLIEIMLDAFKEGQNTPKVEEDKDELY